MGLPWVRFDTQFASNPKVLRLVSDKKWRALTVYVCGLGYCGVHGTDGFVPTGALPFLHATKPDARALVDVGMWLTRPGGWQIKDWDQYQQSDAETQQRKANLTRAAVKANCVRWHGAACGCWSQVEAS